MGCASAGELRVLEAADRPATPPEARPGRCRSSGPSGEPRDAVEASSGLRCRIAEAGAGGLASARAEAWVEALEGVGLDADARGVPSGDGPVTRPVRSPAPLTLLLLLANVLVLFLLLRNLL